MLNYWWVTRPKRRLNSVPEVLSAVTEGALNQLWAGQRGVHLQVEEALEQAGLKRTGTRRDQTGGGGRTYMAWLSSLGLVFRQEGTGRLMLTLAGDALLNGDRPVEILTGQILKYQFPSSFSLSVHVSPRFHIRPFRFLLRLLDDERIQYLTEDEVAKIAVTEAENESDDCFEYIVSRILQYREEENSCLEDDFFSTYGPSKGTVNPAHPFSHLIDIANTMFNWLEFTQLVRRENGKMTILEEKRPTVQALLQHIPPFIDRPDQHEYFQRKYGLDPQHRKDTRNLLDTQYVTLQAIAEQQIRRAYITESMHSPIARITGELVARIAESTGLSAQLVEETLQRLYPTGSVGAFMTEYFEMAFRGREEATEFETATAALFQDVFGFETQHVGPIGLTPDVLIVSDEEGFQAILDNKAYAHYTISNDHHNRMVYNYIGNLDHYSSRRLPLAFFTYIAGGFGPNFDAQVQKIVQASGVPGSGISVSGMIRLVEHYETHGGSHAALQQLFSVNRQILLSDIT